MKWFPDRRGFITGVAVAGFGTGALVTAPVATWLISETGVLKTFAILGAAYFVFATSAGSFLKVAPEGYRPEGWTPGPRKASSGRDYSLGEALKTWQWYALWTLLVLNVCAGISIISQAAPMTEEITGVSATQAATLVGIISIANGAGRFLWAWLSDAIGRRMVFLTMFLLQAGIFFVIRGVTSFGLFSALVCVVLLCYGGGFGTMPAFADDYFGSRDVGSIYGLMLTAWGVGSTFGPLMIANVRQQTGHYTDALYVIAGIMLASAAIPLMVRPPVERKSVEAAAGV
jgi:OFA family oxalate/formate antiporter-like MFS transporter